MSKSRKKKSPKRILAFPDLEQAKSVVLNTLTSVSGQRTYDHAIDDFVDWYCSEPTSGVQSHGSTEISDLPGAERVRSEHHQSAPGGGTTLGL
jgi:hypothetical protein